jgi:hypothetical protein
MITNGRSSFATAAVGAAILLAATSARLSAQQATAAAVHVGDGDLGGVITGKNGPEAGV